jgi:spore maturation protein CgeB
MKLVVFGLTVSSSWGNGHATLWRGLIAALARRGVRVVFFERDVPYYAENRDLTALPSGELVLYADWESARGRARRELADADAAMITSYCPDAEPAAALMASAFGGVSAFYDMDTPVTLARLQAGEVVDYVPRNGLSQFDLVLSYTGGEALTALRERLGARRAQPLYGHVDPAAYAPRAADSRFASDLSYIGTYALDRQPVVEALFIEPARLRPNRKFVLAGAGYPKDFPWTDNIWFVRHLPPHEHPAFYASSRLTVNATRADMAAMGWCPSGRLFEAAACGCPVLSDTWAGLDTFFEPGREILTAGTTEEALAALDRSDAELRRIGAAARERTLAEHTSDHRAAELISMLDSALEGPAPSVGPRSALVEDGRLR